MDLLKINPLHRKRLTSLLGLTLDGSRLEGVLLRRTNGSLQVQQSLAVTLSLDPLTADPELVSREIRNHLEREEIRERHCVVGLPVKWVLTTHVAIPELPEADIPPFLQIEAERGFPADIATLQVCTSRSGSPASNSALMAAIPRNHLAALEKSLRAAKLRPLGFGLGIAALERPSVEGVLALLIGETGVGLQLSIDEGIVALRTLEGALVTEAGRRALHTDVVAREARITLGQVRPEIRDRVRTVRVFGPRDLAQQLADDLELRLEALALKIEVVTRFAPSQFGLQLPADAPVSPALALAAETLAGQKPAFDFLPPRVTAWQQIANRYSSGKLRLAGAAAALLLVIVGLLFGVQQWQLTALNSRWNAISAKVHELQLIQDQIRQYRPWYDESLHGLTILRELTEAFPEEGVVSARTVEIRDLNAVTCTGLAKDNGAWLKTLEKLRASPGVSELKVNQIRGKSPMQFTFDFHWTEGGGQ